MDKPTLGDALKELSGEEPGEVPTGSLGESAPKLRRIPVGGEFSVQQVGDLRKLLDRLHEVPGDRDAQLAAIEEHNPKWKGNKRSPNILYAMTDYGLYDPALRQLTPLAENMLTAADEAELYTIFAREILLHRHGLVLLQIVSALHARGQKAQKDTMAPELRRNGFPDLPADTTNHLTVMNWLTKAGVTRRKGHDDYDFDDELVYRLTGLTIQAVNEWSGYEKEQRFFLRVLKQQAAVHGMTPIIASNIRKRVEMLYPGVAFKGSMRDKVVRPLQEQGWLTTSDWNSAGKSGRVAATQKLLDVDLDLATSLSLGLVPGELRARLNTPLQDIYTILDDKNAPKGDRGIALELLALRIAYDVGLTPMGFRLRAAEAGYAETDLLAEGAHLLFSRWTFQCKAVGGKVDLADLAKEIGMAMLLRAHVVVMVTTGTFTGPLRDHAKKAIENTPLQVILIDDSILRLHRRSGAGPLIDFFESQALLAMNDKRNQVQGIV